MSLRKVHWNQGFQGLKNICMIQEDNKFRVNLNKINNSRKFELLFSKLLFEQLSTDGDISFNYLDQNEYEKINQKKLFIYKQRGKMIKELWK